MEPSAAEASASRPVYSIGAVARMLGAEPATLRAWEERYRVIVPARSQGSHRLYSRDQVEQLRFVLRAMENGSSAADAHRLLAEQLGLPSDVTVAERDVVMLILLADRDRFAAELCKYFLRTEGYEVCLAANTADAERRFVERQPALSVVELVMPGGLGLCRPPWTVRDLSTVSEPLDKLLRYGESLRFFDAEKVGRSVFYDDLGSVLNDGGLSAVLERIDLLVKEHRPSVVVIDSFKALKAFADGEAPFRRFLHELAGGRPHRRILLQPHGLHRGGRLRADRDRQLERPDAQRAGPRPIPRVQLQPRPSLARDGVSLMATLECPELFRITRLSELGMSHIADNVVLLQHLHSGDVLKRALTVLKTRGASHTSTVREFQITSGGITLGEALDLEALLR